MPRPKRQAIGTTFTTSHIYELADGSRCPGGFADDWAIKVKEMSVAWPVVRDQVYAAVDRHNNMYSPVKVPCVHRFARIRPYGWYLFESPFAATIRSSRDIAQLMKTPLFEFDHVPNAPCNVASEWEYLRLVDCLTPDEIATGEEHLANPPAGHAMYIECDADYEDDDDDE